MTNGIHPELLVCQRCQFYGERSSKSREWLYFYYCKLGLDGKKSLKYKEIAKAGWGKTRYKHVPENCPYYLEHLMHVRVQ